MSDTETTVKFGADIAGLKDGASQAAAAVSQSVNQMKDSMTGLGDAAKMLTGLLAGALSVGAMKSAVDAATSYNASILSLSRVMGSTTEQASVLATAIKMIGGTTEEYAAMNMRLGMRIKATSEALEQIGIVLKDGNGDLLSQTEIFNNAIKTMNEYKAGADRNQFALYAFGRGAMEVYKYLNLTEEMMRRATEVAERYGLVIGGDAAQQTKQMTYQLNTLNIIFDAVKIQIGNELLPTVVALAGTLGELAGTVLPYVMGAVKAFMTVFEGLSFAAKMAGAVIVATFASIGGIVSSVARAVMLILKGDFQGAWDAMKGGVSDVKDNFKAAWDSIVADAEKANSRLKAIWMPSGAPAAAGAMPTGGTKSFVAPDTEKGKEDPSRIGQWRDTLEQQKMDEKAYFDFSTEREKTFWAEKLAMTKAGSKERFEVNHIIFELEKKDVQQEIKDEGTRIASANKLAEEAAAAKSREVDTKFKLGEISAKEQIKQEQTLQKDLFAIQMENFSKLEALAEKYPSIWERVQAQIEGATQKHNEKIIGLNDKLSLETKKVFDSLLAPVQSAISTSVKGIILGTTTLQKAIDNLGVSILASFIDMCTKEVMQWISKEATKLGISEMYSKMLIAMGIEEAVEKEAIATPVAVSLVNKNAAVAASGGAAAMASIPYVGPALAVAAAAEMLALCEGFQSLAVAAGGFDVPAGFNPLTQLHAEEMVLPADLAKNVRNMTGGGGGNTVIHINGALDAQSWSNQHGRNLLKGLKSSAKSLGIRV
jgi:hypothetical protein